MPPRDGEETDPPRRAGYTIFCPEGDIDGEEPARVVCAVMVTPQQEIKKNFMLYYCSYVRRKSRNCVWIPNTAGEI